jgi:ferric-dicitrate binding protein FerR (iron transport regulator)
VAFSDASPSPRERRGRRPLSLEVLAALEAREAAAYLVVRRSEGLTRSEQLAFEVWLAADDSHPEAFAAAERVWGIFDQSDDNEILASMRAYALTSRVRTGSGRRWAAAAAIAIGLVAGVLLNRVTAARRLSMRFRQVIKRHRGHK